MNYVKYNNNILNKNTDDGFFDLNQDKKAIQAFIDEYLEPNKLKFDSEESRWEYLIKNKYYLDLVSLYNKDEFFKLVKDIKSKPFEFASFMSISKFYNDYALKSFDKKYILEDYEDRILCISFYLANGDINLAKTFAYALKKQWYQPATPTFLNSGKYDGGELISCFLLDTQDSIDSINYSISNAMKLSKIGGGVAINLSKLRSRGSYIKNVKNVAKGVVPVMKIFEDVFKYADQLGQRKGAGAIYLNIFHNDVLEFLDTKKINADENSRIQTLSLGLVVPTKFFELTRDGKSMYTFDPKNIEDVLGVTIDDIDFDQRYDELVANDKIVKKQLDSRKLLIKIAQLQFESGYPYLMFKSNVNKSNPLNNIGSINMSNLCTEIFQVQKPSNIKPIDEQSQYGYDISCNLGSINIVNVMENNSLEESIFVATKMLDQVSSFSNLTNVPTVNLANKKFHSIGLGAMNLNSFLAKNNIRYDSEEAIEFADKFFEAFNYYSLKASNLIAKERNATFEGFEGSKYHSGEYFENYCCENKEFKHNNVKKLFEKIKLPTTKDWKQLKENVKNYGLYHSYRLAIAPTQSISYLQNASASVMPITELIEQRVYKNSTTYYPMPFLNKETRKYYQEAWYIDQKSVIDMISTIQKHVDQGISCVLHVTSDASVKDLVKLYTYAMSKGLKSLYYTRTKNLSIDECLSCSI